MKTEITTAIITGCFTLGATLLAFFLKRVNNLRNYTNSTKWRSLSGKWRGKTIQTNGRTAILTLGEIYSKRKSFVGNIQVTINTTNLKLKFKGYYIDDSYILVSYKSCDPNIKNFGSQVLKLNADGNKLTGVTIGYGNIEEGITQGETILEKYT